MSTDTRDMRVPRTIAEIREEALNTIRMKHARELQRAKTSLLRFAEVLKWVDENIPDSQIVRNDVDAWGDATVYLTTPTRREAFALAAEIVRATGMKINRHPKPDAETLYWHVHHRENDDHPILTLLISPKSCQRIKVGTKTVEQDVYDVVCSDPEPEINGAAS